MPAVKTEQTEPRAFQELIRPLEEMRRQPQQERSRRMVLAIIQAAHAILLEHGREGLSTTALEAVSGVGKSSIYQYFPNLDAIVFEVYRHVIRQCQLQEYEAFPGQQPRTVLSFIYWLLDWSIDIHRKLLAIDRTLLLDHRGFWDTWQELDQNLAPDSSTEHFIYQNLKHCSDFVPGDNDVMRVHALGRTAQLLVYSMMADNADFIDDPEFRHMLARMCLAAMAPA